MSSNKKPDASTKNNNKEKQSTPKGTGHTPATTEQLTALLNKHSK